MQRRTGKDGSIDYTLTVREHQVLQAICSGRTNREIGRDLRIELQSVKTYVHNFLLWTGMRNRTELCHWAHSTPGMLKNGFTVKEEPHQ